MTGPDLRDLLALFPPPNTVRAYEFVPAERVPQPYHTLLVHDQHMTVTVEAYHGTPVDVRVLEHRLEGDVYARTSLLLRRDTGRVVQFGLVRIFLQFCSPPVRDEILARQTPLGRILISHDVLRTIHPTAFLRVIPGPALQEWYGLADPVPTFGRLAVITCDGQPAIEVLEIVAPER